VTNLNVSGGLVSNTIQSFVTAATVNLTGGTMAGGTHHLISSTINSKASGTASTIASALLIRKDYGSTDLSIDVEDGGAATDLLISGNIGATAAMSLTKTGVGTLALSGANSYTGNTEVKGGVLSIGSTNSLGAGAVIITNSAVMNLNYAGQIEVASVILNGVAQSGGTFGAIGSGATHESASFTGSGLLYVYTPGPPTLSYVSSGGNLTFTWTGSGSLEWQTNSLSTGLGTNWTAYPNGTNGVTVPVDAAQGSVFFRVAQ
jgi:autotransporter-associated beta strand protein